MPSIQRTQYPNEYSKLKKLGKEMEENNDCVVIAIAALTGKSYNTVHRLCEENGRKKKRGTNNLIAERVFDALGYKLVRVNARKTFISKYPYPHNQLKHVTSHHPRRFNAHWKNGKHYYACSSSHAFAIKDGKVLDWSVNNSLRVKSLWEVVKND